MAVVAEIKTVGTTPTLLTLGGSSIQDLSVVYLRNDSPVDIFLGGSTVTTGTGFRLPAGTQFPLDLAHHDAVYGIVASGTQPLQVLRTRGQ